MKKIIGLLLALMLTCTLCTPVFAAEEKSETFICNGSLNVEGEYFNLSASYISQGGWEGGMDLYPITITPREDNLLITHIDAHVCYYGNLYERIGVSKGIRVPNSLGNAKTGDISVVDINQESFAFTNGTNIVPFDRITVYFVKSCAGGDHSYNDDNVCLSCGKTRCELEGHSLNNGLCELCGFFDAAKHEHLFDADGSCTCGQTKCKVEGHSYEPATVYRCHICGEEAPAGYTGSTLSEGNMSIIVGVASAVVFGFGGFLLGRKKKPVPSNGMAGEDEE